MFHDLLGTVDDHVRHTCQLRYLDAVALVRTSFYDLTQEHDIVATFFHSNAIVVHIVHFAFQLGQLMVMGSEQCLGS